jgi:hypothetical protein
MSFIKTPEHIVIESAVQSGKNTLVPSGPGTGKTTMLAKLIVPILTSIHAGKQGAAMALNVSNANDLKTAINHPNVECATVCATLWRVYKASNPAAKVVVAKKAGKDFRGIYRKAQMDKMALLVDEHFQKELGSEVSFETAISLVSHAKKAAFGIVGHPDIDDRDAWQVLAKRHILIETPEIPDADAEGVIEGHLDEQITYAIKLLKLSNADYLRVNFDDQLYLPLLRNVKLPSLAFIIYDEFQDVKPIEVEYLRRYNALGTQIVGVGDSRQYAYEFAGALFNAFEFVASEFNMEACPMRISWRCSHAAANLANGVFPDSVIPAPNAKIGTESVMAYTDLFDKVGDLDCHHGLLSRTHKNLLPAALKLLAAKKPFWYKGIRDLVGKMERMLWHHAGKKDVTNLTVIRESLTEYQNQCEEKYLTPAGNLPKWVTAQSETVDALNLLLANCEGAGEGIECVKSYLKTLSESDRKNLDGPALCTIHVSKGLEWSNVYVIGPCQSTLAKTDEQLYAEKCLEFVAYSRSSENVTIVTLDDGKKAA